MAFTITSPQATLTATTGTITVSQSSYVLTDNGSGITITTINGGGSASNVVFFIPASGSAWRFGTGGNIDFFTRQPEAGRPILLVYDPNSSTWRESSIPASVKSLNGIVFADPNDGASAIENAVAALGGEPGLVVVPTAVDSSATPGSDVPVLTVILDLRVTGDGGFVVQRWFEEIAGGYNAIGGYAMNGVPGTTYGGSVTTNGTTTLTGSGTSFLSQFQPGYPIYVEGESGRTVVSIQGNLQLTVDWPYSTATGGLTYAGIIRSAVGVHGDTTYAGEGTDVNAVEGMTASRYSAGVYGVNFGGYALATGTVAVTLNSTTVIGSGTSFTTQLLPGIAIMINGNGFTVASIQSNTQLTLNQAYPEPSDSGFALTYLSGGPGVQGDGHGTVMGGAAILGVSGSKGLPGNPAYGIQGVAYTTNWAYAGYFESTPSSQTLPAVRISSTQGGNLSDQSFLALAAQTTSPYGAAMQLQSNNTTWQIIAGGSAGNYPSGALTFARTSGTAATPLSLSSSGVTIGSGGAPISRVLYATAPWNAGSIGNVSSAVTTINVTNAVPGNPCVAAFTAISDSIGSGRTLITANVTSSGVVTVTLMNLTGSAKTYDGTLNVMVWQA